MALARTMAEMVQGLRDRDFIRDVLGRYVSPELAEQCVRDRNVLRLGGEIRTVSILMSDLRGFSGLSERLGPERMIALLNRYLGCMTPVILRHRGTINEFIGDAILVLFGAPFERPDDAERAVRCAWAMQLAMAGFNAESRAHVQRRMENVYELFPELDALRKQIASSMSGGQQQMLALGRVLIHEPELLMIDELSLGLAPVVVTRLIEVVEELKSRGQTMVIVEQSLNVAISLADRAIFMEKGQVRFEGSTDGLLERGDLARAVFFGTEGG